MTTTTKSPTANENSTWDGPTYAYADGGSFAVATTSGNAVTYKTFGFSLGSDEISSVVVYCDAWTAQNEFIDIDVSWDGGVNWSTPIRSPPLTTGEATYPFDVTGATAWTPTKLNNTNFKVRVKATANGAMKNVYLDWIRATVIQTAPGTATSYIAETERVLTELNAYLSETRRNISVLSGYPGETRRILSGAPIPSGGGGWLTGWDARKKHHIDSSPDGALSNYNVRLTLHYGSGSDDLENVYTGSRCKTDFGDIRFTLDDGTTELKYFQDPVHTVGSNYAEFWVKIPSLPASDGIDIHVYYDNPEATSTSSGPDTFLFFDDFESNNLNKWDTSGANGHFATQSDVVKEGTYAVKCDGNTTNGGSIHISSDPLNITSGGRLTHMHCRIVQTTGWDAYLGMMIDGAEGWVYGLIAYSGYWKYYQGAYANWPSNNTYTKDTWYELDYAFDLAQIKQYAWRDRASMGSINLKNHLGSNVTEVDRIFLMCTNLDRDYFVDQYWIRNFTLNEPVHSTWYEEEEAPSGTPTEYLGETRRIIVISTDLLAETRRILSVLGTYDAETLRILSFLQEYEAETKRRLANEGIYYAETERKPTLLDEYLAETERILMVSTDFLGETRRKLIALGTYDAETRRILSSIIQYNAETERSSMRLGEYSGETKRKLMVSIALLAETLRRLVTLGAYDAETLRILSSIAQYDAETRRGTTLLDEYPAETLRKIITQASAFYPGETLRRIANIIYYLGETERATTRETFYTGETVRNIIFNYIYSAESLRQIISAISYDAETKRSISGDMTYQGESLRRLSSLIDYIGETERDITSTCAYSGETLRQIINATSYIAETKRLVSGGMIYSAEGLRRLYSLTDYIAETIRDIILAPHLVEFKIMEMKDPYGSGRKWSPYTFEGILSPWKKEDKKPNYDSEEMEET